ncbi:MAG: CopG family transcriptional regulator [Cyanobacteriota bacterium]|nr:CopG family transcriptional regulator [Cyanobacteriota bacterium]
MPSKNLRRITTYVQPQVARELEQWAEEEERSVSWLAGKLLEKGIREHQDRQQPQVPSSETKE